MLFCGDTPSCQDIGRYNPGCDVPVLLQSVRTKLFTLPDETVVYSGHGPSFTIGYARQHDRTLVM